MSTNYPLDILIPVYNEGQNIIAVVDSLRCHVKTPFRIIICYDHDTDDTLAALDKYEHRSQVVIEFVKNRAQGVLGAIKTGLQECKAPAILIFPADDTHNANIVDQMHALFVAGSSIVAPSRFMRGGCMVGCPWLKAFLVRTAAFTLFHLARLPTHDPTNGFRFFSRRVFDQIPIETPEGWAFSLELLVKAHRRGWKISEVPALWHERKAGKSNFRVLKWLPIYLRWYFYAFKSIFVRKANRH